RSKSSDGPLYSCCSPSSAPSRRAAGSSNVELALRQHLGERARHRRAETLGETFGEILLLRVVEDVLGLDHLAGDEIDAPKAVRKPQFDAPRARPQQP